MPDPIPVTITAGNYQQGYCYPSTPQQLLNDTVPLLIATVPGLSLFNFGPNTPAVDLQQYPWLRTDSSGIIDGWYTFSGAWLRPYPVPFSTAVRWMWTDTEANLQTFDGGNTSPITDRTGPFWQVDHNYDLRMPFGPDSATINVNDTGGSQNATLASGNIPSHNHLMPQYYNDDITLNSFYDISGGKTPVAITGVHVSQGSFATWPQGPGNSNYQLSTYNNGSGSPTALSLMNPYRGTFIIKRTARKYIVAP